MLIAAAPNLTPAARAAVERWRADAAAMRFPLRPGRRPARPPRTGRPGVPLGRHGPVPGDPREVPDDRAAPLLPPGGAVRRARAVRHEQMRGGGGAGGLPRATRADGGARGDAL